MSIDNDPLDYVCPKCGMPPGMPCQFSQLGQTPRQFGRDVNGRTHVARIKRAKQAVLDANDAWADEQIMQALARMRYEDTTGRPWQRARRDPGRDPKWRKVKATSAKEPTP